jgi:hypothetical protein
MPRLRADRVLREMAETPASMPDRLARLHDKAIALVEGEQLIAPAFCSRVVKLDQCAGEFLIAEGEVLHAPRLQPSEGELTALACGVATLGPALERKVTSLFAARQPSLALALDRLGNQLLHIVSRHLHDAMLVGGRRLGLTLAGELRPGDPGLALEAQGSLLRLAGASRIGVTVSAGHALQPLKSVSVLLGAGIGLPRATWSRCDDCRSRQGCALAARSDAPALP